MTYEEVLTELQEVDLKEKFASLYEGYTSESLLKMMKGTDRLHSTAGMIRGLMKYMTNESEEWLYWQKVLFYFMTPIFARKRDF